MEDISRYRVLFIAMIILEDLLILNALYLGIFQMFERLVDLDLEQCQILLVMVNLSYLASTLLYPVRVDVRNMEMSRLIRNVLTRVTLTMFISVVSMFLANIAHEISRAFIVLFFSSFFVSTVVIRALTRSAMRYFLKHAGAHTTAVILGAGRLGHKLYNEVTRKPYLGINIRGFFDDNPKKNGGVLLGNIEDMKRYVKKHDINQIYCTLPLSAREKILDVIDFAEHNVIQFHVVPGLRYYIDRPVVLESVGSMPILSIRKVPLAYAHNAYLKRTFDIAASLLFLLTIFPLIFIAVGAAVKLNSPGPVFFRQERTGIRGRNFVCYKFRSMRVDGKADKRQDSDDDDSRITRTGNFLRRTGIDELPQFINILRGDMSIVGPRPHMKSHTSEYSKTVDKYMVRHFIKPGITGLAQVMGYRGGAGNVEEMEGRIMRDIWYIEHWTIWLDMRIIARTFMQLLRRDAKAF